MTHISRYTPSTMLPETLEAIFVQREGLAVDTVHRIRESALRGNHHYLLFIGPRGCGKTHFVSLIFHRLRKIEELADALRIAWLTEDETSTSFLDLQLRIYRALSRDYSDEFPPHVLDRLYDLPPKNAVHQVSREIVSRLKDRAGLVIVENLDQIFDDMGDEGQHAWRAFLQESSRFSILATAQQLFPGVSSRNAPFFGSFQTEYFEPLTDVQGRKLLMNIARLHDDRELMKFLSTPRGRARVRALQHLSGGNHRVYVVLSEFINARELDELIGPFEKTLDDLTPYYQERLRWLSSQQRRIVEHLCKLDRPVPVREIARALFTSSQSISRQLLELKGKRYVRSATRGRESLYELTEPLMRMALELKEHRGGPIRLIVDFLRVWYDRSFLDSRLRRLPETARLERIHVEEAIRRIDDGEEHPCVTALRRDLERLQARGDETRIRAAMEELEEFRESFPDWVETTSPPFPAGDPSVDIETATRIIDRSDVTAAEAARAFFVRGLAKGTLGDAEGEIEDYTQVIELEGAPPERVAKALVNRGITKGELGDAEGEIEDYTRVIELEGSPPELVAKALVNRGFTKGQLGDAEGEIEDYTHVIELEGAPPEQVVRALVNRGIRKGQLGDAAGEIEDYTCVIELEGVPREWRAMALNDRAVHLYLASRFEEAQRDVTSCLSLFPDLPQANYTQAELLLASGRWEQGWKALADCLHRFPPHEVGLDEVDPMFLVRILFKSTHDPATWAARVEKLVELYDTAKALTVLGDGLVRSVADLVNQKPPSADMLAGWRAAWHSAGRQRQSLTLALRLFDVALDYVESRDPKSLLDLPIEQRTLLEQMFGISAEDD